MFTINTVHDIALQRNYTVRTVYVHTISAYGLFTHRSAHSVPLYLVTAGVMLPYKLEASSIC